MYCRGFPTTDTFGISIGGISTNRWVPHLWDTHLLQNPWQPLGHVRRPHRDTCLQRLNGQVATRLRPFKSMKCTKTAKQAYADTSQFKLPLDSLPGGNGSWIQWITNLLYYCDSNHHYIENAYSCIFHLSFKWLLYGPVPFTAGSELVLQTALCSACYTVEETAESVWSNAIQGLIKMHWLLAA